MLDHLAVEYAGEAFAQSKRQLEQLFPIGVDVIALMEAQQEGRGLLGVETCSKRREGHRGA